jgi:hypothetical protein
VMDSKFIDLAHSGLFEVAEVNGFIRIRCSQCYPDGTVIDLFYREENQGPILSDMGETSRLGFVVDPAQSRIAKSVIVDVGISEKSGILFTEAINLDQAIERMIHAIITISNDRRNVILEYLD